MGQRAEVIVDGEAISLNVRRNPRARRILLKVDMRSGAQLVIPRGVGRREALSFAAEKGAWLRDRLASLPPRVPFSEGETVPILGELHRIRQTPIADLFRSGVWRDGGNLVAACEADEVADKVRAWFRSNAKEALAAKAHETAAGIGAQVNRITVRDPHTRWGSCSAAGTLSFSWRLFMAPEWVMDYVVAHEVAHLFEMNHGQTFWRLVGGLVDRIDEAKDWLRQSGPELHRYG